MSGALVGVRVNWVIVMGVRALFAGVRAFGVLSWRVFCVASGVRSVDSVATWIVQCVCKHSTYHDRAAHVASVRVPITLNVRKSDM
jgi:hypothetical protein